MQRTDSEASRSMRQAGERTKQSPLLAMASFPLIPSRTRRIDLLYWSSASARQ